MSDQRKVFLSYRRALSPWLARSVFQSLRSEDYDVFMDVEGLGSGQFPPAILHQIDARTHFVIVLVPGSLERTINDGDWLRREIEHALHVRRNVVPLMADGFTFEAEAKRLGSKQLPKKIKELSDHNGLNVHTDYFDEGMKKLRDRFLTKQVSVALTPTPVEDKNIVERMTTNASLANASPLDRILKWNAQIPLGRPTLTQSKADGVYWEWTEVPLASGYVLQKSVDQSFTEPLPIYDGDATRFPPPFDISRDAVVGLFGNLFATGPGYFRVKAKGGFAFSDSPWSEVVKGQWRKPAAISVLTKIPLIAPILRLEVLRLKWTKVPGATGYVLQESNTRLFETPTQRYDGAETIYALASKEDPFAAYIIRSKYFRVKAKGSDLFDDSPWSDIVEL
ncbi:MAG TPA: toll/interleukin-1 receptor domain-containing protein [Vicinamibacterales bacterium]|jgi:hypothetical protein